MTIDPKILLTTANAAVARGDHAGLLESCTDDIVWHFVGDRTLSGKAAILRYMDETYLEPPEVEVDALIADADHVVAIGRITLVDGDGVRTTSDYCDAWRLRDGRLAELHAFVMPRSPSSAD